MSTTLVKNGTVVTASDRYTADIVVDKGVITLVGQGLNLPADTVVDASGKLVLPGGIDVHTHLDMPFGGTTSADDFESGTIAAAHGGTTTVVDFAIQNFGEGLYPAFEGWMKRAEGRAAIDYAFHMIVRELTDAVSGDMDRLTRHDGVTSFKLFMAYPGVFQVDDATIFRALLKTKENGGLDFQWATRPEERSKLWEARHNAYFACLQLKPGSRAISTDVCVPISRLAECVVETTKDIEKASMPIPLFGHVGDGNFHLVILIDPNSKSDMEEAKAINLRVVKRALAMEGTCTGEHGIGIGKQSYLVEELGEAVDLMKDLKRSFDPENLLNPGKVVPLQ